MVFNDYGKNGKVLDKKVDPIHQCKREYFRQLHWRLALKTRIPGEKSSHHETHSEKTSITFMVPPQISSQVASPEMMIISSKSALTTIKNPVTPFPQFLYINSSIQLHFLAIPSFPHSQICL